MPRVNQLLNWVMGINFLCGIVFLLTIVYEYGFRISAAEYNLIHTVYHTVWVIFLVTTTIQIVFRQEDSSFKFTPWTWILTILLYLTLLPVVFKKPEETTGVYWVWVFFHHAYYKGTILVLLSFSQLSGILVRLLGKRTNPGRQFPGVYSVGYRIVDASSGHLPRHFVHGCAVYRHECDVRHRACHRRCAFHLYAGGTNSDYSPDSDRRTRGDDADKFLCHVFYGEYLAL